MYNCTLVNNCLYPVKSSLICLDAVSEQLHTCISICVCVYWALGVRVCGCVWKCKEGQTIVQCVHTHICHPRHSITGEPWTAKLLTDRAFHIDHTDLWGRWCTSHLFKSLGWFLFLLPGLTRTLIVIPVHKSFGGCLIHRSRKQWTWHDTFSYSQTSIITNCALQGCGWPGRPARGRMVVQVFWILLRN